MLETNLTKSLCHALAGMVKDMLLPTKSGAMKVPQIVNGYLPPKRSTASDDFPFVLVRADAGESERGVTMVTVDIVMGCYTMETDGYELCLEMMQRIRMGLCTLPAQTLEGKFQLQFPIAWKNIPDQPYPQWQIEMTTHWTFTTPQLTDYGEGF